VLARLRRASPASLRWRFYRFARCRAARALLQPLSSPSALGRRRARSLEASVASFHTLAYPPLCAEDQDVLGRLGMRQVRLIFPTEEEWRNPALLLRRTYPALNTWVPSVGVARRKGRGFGCATQRREKKEEEEEEKKKKKKKKNK